MIGATRTFFKFRGAGEGGGEGSIEEDGKRKRGSHRYPNIND